LDSLSRGSENTHEPFRDYMDIMICSPPASVGAHLGGQLPVQEQLKHPVGKSLNIAGTDEESFHSVLNDGGHVPNARCHHRPTGGHSLKQTGGHPFASRRQDDNSCTGHLGCDIGRPARQHESVRDSVICCRIF
jgi:hypothetical protein